MNVFRCFLKGFGPSSLWDSDDVHINICQAAGKFPVKFQPIPSLFPFHLINDIRFGRASPGEGEGGEDGDETLTSERGRRWDEVEGREREGSAKDGDGKEA